MGFRFRRTIKVLPGIRLNLSRSGVSLSAGVRGASVTVGKGGVHANVGLPGTGLSYRTRIDPKSNTLLSGRKSSDPHSTETNVLIDLDASHKLIITDDHGQALTETLQRQVRRDYKDAILSLLEQSCERLNEPLQAAADLHLDTPSADTLLDWPEFYQPLDEPCPQALDYPEIGWLDRLLPWRARALVQQWESRCQNQRLSWQRRQDEHKQQQHEVWTHRFDTPARTTGFLYDLLQQINWPHQIRTRVRVDNAQQHLAVTTLFPEITEFPGVQYQVLEKSWRLSSKGLTATQKRMRYMHYVHAIGFRIIGELFRAVPIQTLTFSGCSRRFKPAEAGLDEQCLYSLRVSRSQWQAIDFSRLAQLDLPELMATFELRRNMTKTGIFRAVDPFSTSLDKSAGQLLMPL